MFWQIVLFIVMVIGALFLFNILGNFGVFVLIFFVPFILLMGISWFLPFEWGLTYWHYVVIVLLYRLVIIRDKG